MRLFLGISLSQQVSDELLAISLRYRSTDDGLRWSLPESWHITLQFLGTVSEQQYSCILPPLHALRHAPVAIQIESLDFFDRAGIFFAGVRLTPGLISLQQQITSATAHCGFAAEAHPFRPHITLARTKGRRGSAGLHSLKTKIKREPAFSSFVSEEFLLYESHLAPSGSQYEVREHFPFAVTHGT